MNLENNEASENDIREFDVSDDSYGQRLDQIVVDFLPDYSRSRIQKWIKQGSILVNNMPSKAKSKLKGGEHIRISIEQEEQGEWLAEDIPLDIIYEDESILVINKPVNMVVHPAAGNYSGTMLNALLFHCPELINIPRAGIVHRLDKDTSGLLVVAKTLTAQTHLVKQLQKRAFEREYEAIVMGEMTGGGIVNAPIGRHPTQRVKMAVMKNPNNGKEAITHYRIKERLHDYTCVQVRLETGRTHQIRVHMAHINYPVVGDPVYAGRLKLPADCSEELKQYLLEFKRQALHARKLGLKHPQNGQWIEWEVEAPQDMQRLKALLKEF